jgi:hypothetical protein
MRIAGLLKSRVWGFKMIEVSAFLVLIALALAVYLAKVRGGRDAQEITSIEHSIAQERREIRLLRAAVAKNEQPARIEQLSTAYLKMAPASQKQEIPEAALIDIARGPHPAAPVKPPPPLAGGGQ